MHRRTELHEFMGEDMLHFFPSTFPDETLYSRLARYHRLSGHADDRDSLHELVGVHTHVITSDLPSLLQTLISKIPAGARPSIEEIINSNTIFPYFQRFLPLERCGRAVSAMSGTSTAGLKTSIGLVASRLGANNTFRFCGKCVNDDRDAFGQAYWHRVHQLPGVWVCPRHTQALFELDFRTVQLKRHKLFLPDDPLAELASRQLPLTLYQIDALLRIAWLSTSVLLNPQPGWNAQSLNELHRNNARRNGLVRDNGRIYVAELANILESYSSDFPAAGEYAIVHRHFLNWALRLLRKPRGTAVHPMRHLLLMDCLRGARPTHLDEGTSDPPWVATKNEGHKVDQLKLIVMLGQKGKSLRHAAAEFGLSVTTVGIEAARLGLPVARKPKTITEDVKCRVYGALRRGLAPKEVAETHGLSQVSVYRILRMNGALAKEYSTQRFKLIRDAHRERFAGQTSDRADYAWLYRNDREWLAEQQGKASKGESQRERSVDWAERDELLAEQVANINDAMRSGAKRPRWISRSALKRETGMADTIERNADKLPLTHLGLSARSESREEYQRRRLLWAAGELKKLLHGRPPRWLLLRQAGIRVLARNNEMLVDTLTLDRPLFQ